MTKEEIQAIIDLIDAKIAIYAARNSSDGGLIESLLASQYERTLKELASDD